MESIRTDSLTGLMTVETEGQEIMASREHEVLLALLRAGLWEREPENLSCFPLSDESWENVFRLARQQTVTGLIFVGLQYLADRFSPPETLLIRWAAEADAIERKNRKMNMALEELYALFRKKGLEPVLQKGQGVARFYARPWARECGDIDFYFPDCRAWETNPFLQGFANRLERQKGYQFITLSAVSKVGVTVPSSFLELLLLNLHILKHALGRGIGLRQLCDMARACHQLHEEVDSQEMKTVCQRLGLAKWSPLLHAFLVDSLGLPIGCLPYQETASTAQPLNDIIWRGGNFGHYDAGLERKADGWQRKWHTARSFNRNIRFACHYAPKEAAWLFIQLVKGQCK